jgi:hypothetical protein
MLNMVEFEPGATVPVREDHRERYAAEAEHAV